LTAESGKVEIAGHLIDRDLLFNYLRVQFSEMGATGIFDLDEQDRIERKFGSLDDYRIHLHDEIYRQAGFASYDADHPSLARYDEGVGEAFENALKDYADNMVHFRELNEQE
jgi:hypothetical protein